MHNSEKMLDVTRAVSTGAEIILYGVVAFVAWHVLATPDVGGWIFCAAVIYLAAPIKHPCDYNSYLAWWKDRKNWCGSNKYSAMNG